MIALVLVIAIMVSVAFFRLKFDENFATQIVEEENNLSLLNKLAIIVIAIAAIFYLFEKTDLAFFTLLLVIPFVLYLHFKTYIVAFIELFKNK